MYQPYAVPELSWDLNQTNKLKKDFKKLLLCSLVVITVLYVCMIKNFLLLEITEIFTNGNLSKI